VSGAVAGRGFAVRALGEVAIRCRDLDAMARFYGETLGLERLAARPGGIVFFRLGDGWRGHTAVLALFADDQTPASPSSLHHIALSVDWDAQEAAQAWLRAQGLPVRVEHFDWIGWRGVFTADPEGNTVELVAARPAEAP